MQSLQQSARLTRACAECREKKVKCSGGVPCATCYRLGINCFYPLSRRGKRPQTEPSPRPAQRARWDVSSFTEEERSAILQSLTDTLHARTSLSSPLHNQTLNDGNGRQQQTSVAPSSGVSTSPTASDARRTHDTASPSSDETQPRLEEAATSLALPMQPQPRTIFAADHALGPDDTSAEDVDQPHAVVKGIIDEKEYFVPLHSVNWEYHGPWSWASICSRRGIRWVCDRTKSEEFGDIAGRTMKAWSKRLKMQRSQTISTRYPEPDQETAWKYVSAYFEGSNNAIFAILSRNLFEARLIQHFNTKWSTSLDDQDPAWYALRNAVYATGCRLLLADDSSLSFNQAESQAAQYFYNALSVFGQIMFGHSGLTAVQALLIMTFHSSGIASACIEYPLCKSTVQMAQAKGLHREPSGKWGLSSADIQSRNWLWWTIYSVEKSLSLRSGRPSSIDDGDINTPIPTKAPPGSQIDVETVTLIFRHAEICSQVISRISCHRAARPTFREASTIARDLKDQLNDLLQRISQRIDINSTEARANAKSAERLLYTYLYSDVHTTLIASQVVFFDPWISCIMGRETSSVFREQVAMSGDLVAHSSRQILSQLRHHKITVTDTVMSSFFHPMYAFIHLFLYVLKHPQASTIMGDLALLDVATGHFGQLELASDGILAFHLPRECTALCLKAIRVAKDLRLEPVNTVAATPQSTNLDSVETTNMEGGADDFNTRDILSWPEDLVLDDPFSAMDFDNGCLNTFDFIDMPDVDLFGSVEGS